MDSPEAETAGVIAPPPSIFAAPLMIGPLLDRVQPLTWLPRGVARALGLPLPVGGVTVNAWTL